MVLRIALGQGENIFTYHQVHHLPFRLDFAPRLLLPDFGVVLDALSPLPKFDSGITRSPSFIS